MTPSEYPIIGMDGPPELLGTETLEDKRRRVTEWKGGCDLPWIEKQRVRFEASGGQECEILRRQHKRGVQFALFYKYGFFKWSDRLNKMLWHEIKNQPSQIAA